MGEDLFEGLTFDEFIRRAQVERPQPRNEPEFLPWDAGHEGHGHFVRGKWGMALGDFVRESPATAARIAAETAVDFSPAGVAKAAVYDLPLSLRRFKKDPSLLGAAEVFLSGLGAVPGGATAAKLATIPFLARPTREGMEQARRALAPYNEQAVAQALDQVAGSPQNVNLAFMNPQEFLDLAPEFAGGRPQIEKLANLGDVPPGGLSELPFLTVGSMNDPLDVIKSLEESGVMDREFASEMTRLIRQQYGGGEVSPLVRNAIEQFERLGEGTPGVFAHEGRHRNVQALLRGDEASPVLLRSWDAPLEDIFGSPLTVRQGPIGDMGEMVHAPTTSGRVADQLEVVRQLQPEFPYSHQGWMDMMGSSDRQYGQNIQRLARQAPGDLPTPPTMAAPRITGDALQRYEDIFGELSDIRGSILGKPVPMSFESIMGIR